MALLARQTQHSAFLGRRPALAARPVASGASRARTAVVPQALFGFGKKAESSDAAGVAAPLYICIDCGWVYPDGDVRKAPASFRCPACNSPKSRFKVYKGAAIKGRPNNTGAAMKKRFAAKEW